ncbi:unnamed protein product [Amoebophrya sp. A25]|nr:unnamed protein product [Amoebophrya sp. A25]|eukprot:GSA25T00017632001.1
MRKDCENMEQRHERRRFSEVNVRESTAPVAVRVPFNAKAPVIQERRRLLLRSRSGGGN